MFYRNVFRYLIPLENGVTLHLPMIHGRIVQSLVEIGTMVLEKKITMKKNYSQTGRLTEGR